MMNLFQIFIVGTICAAAFTNGFLFHKFKNGCDPDPCKHDSKCQLDPKNANLSTCICKGEYTGVHCELKTGCYSKPCKNDGECKNDHKDATKFKCKCPPGFVGDSCDTKDACFKNPCSNGGKCSLDAKLKAVCECPPGYGSKECDKRNCSIVEFKGKHFTKASPTIYIDKSWEETVKSLDELAKLCKVKIHVEKSFELHQNEKSDYDLRDKLNPNHYIGQALSIKVYDEKDHLLCDETCLKKVPIPEKGAKCLIDGLHAIQVKWSILDPSTIHSGFHVSNLRNYNSLRENHQIGCRESAIDSCYKNPCKHKGTCQMNAKNESYCICTSEYTGDICDKKTGCYGDPCKYGKCTNDPKDLTKHTCKCDEGIVGPKCDIKDPCVHSNPCKSGRCTLDEKFKAQCSCPLGFGSTKCDKKNCTITQFKGKQLSKFSAKVFIDKSIENKLVNLDDLAKLCKVRLNVITSFIKHPNPNATKFDFKDQIQPMHYIGQALSLHLYSDKDTLLCNDVCLGKLIIPVSEAKCFIDGLSAIGWNWSRLNPTTVYNGLLHQTDIKHYNEMREHIQTGCRDESF